MKKKIKKINEKNKRKNYRYLNKKATISYLQIIILIMASFAFSYMVASYDWDVEADLGDVCCEETRDGISCQSAPMEQCNPSLNISPTVCEDTSYCQIGCCISEKTGICNRNTAKKDCEGIFELDALCNTQECKRGCCIIGDQAKWTTEKNCEFEGNTQNLDLPTEFLFDSSHNTELKCLFSKETGAKGACLYSSGNETKCTYTTLEECVARTGSESSFDRLGRYCSDPALNTTCTAKDHKGCEYGEEDVYWYDSCDNKEDVAEDCDLYTGTFCGEKDDEFICEDVNCVIDGEIRMNGESWCEYDGAIGIKQDLGWVEEEYQTNFAGSNVISEPGKEGYKDRYGRDTVGSRHVKHICYMGKERLEPCADYRNEICVERLNTLEDGRTFSESACRVNQWRTCLDIATERNNIPRMVKLCNENVDCFVKHVKMGEGFDFKLCVPRYPPGFYVGTPYDEEGSRIISVAGTGENVCSVGDQECKQDMVCGIFGCSCVTNCLCDTAYFTEKMNELCISLGDCGGYVNYNGEYTDEGYRVEKAPRLGSRVIEEYKKNAEPHPNQPPAHPGTLEFFKTLNPESLIEVPSDYQDENLPGNLSAFQRELLAVAGSLGSPLLLQQIKELKEGEEDEFLNSITPGVINFARYGNAAATAKSSISAQIVYEKIEVKDFSMIAALIAGLIAYLITQSILWTLIFAALAFFLFLVWHEEKYINFYCSPWIPQDGGASCEKCNTLEIPCSEYRCQSLGQLCKFINKGTSNELCISEPEDSRPPKIEPLYSVISEGYEYFNVNDAGFELVNSENKGCVEAFATIKMGIKVDPAARCRFGIDPTQDYEEMTEIFGPKGNLILPVHQMFMFLPSPEAFGNTYNLTEEQIEEIGKVNYYVKCKTPSGRRNPDLYTIKTCIYPGPDLTAPRIVITDPINGGFIEYGKIEQDVKVYVNEPSECRWSLKDENFEQMENLMNCETSINKYTQWGLPCNLTVDNLDENSKFYFRCMDLSENNNIMKESYVYELSTSKTPLTISDFKPEEDSVITEGFEPVSVTLKVSTKGGAEDGKAICEWSGNGYFDRFSETESDVHSYELTNAVRGSYNLNFNCWDAAGNIANAITKFKVKVDGFGPQIIRVYYENGLKIITSEDAECRYSFNRNFKFDNSTSMGQLGKEHYADWQLKNYYIQCQDEFNNKGGKLMIKAYELLNY